MIAKVKSFNFQKHTSLILQKTLLNVPEAIIFDVMYVIVHVAFLKNLDEKFAIKL